MVQPATVLGKRSRAESEEDAAATAAAAAAAAIALSGTSTAVAIGEIVGASEGEEGGSEADEVVSYSKLLDYKSCESILCLSKEMARDILPQVDRHLGQGQSHQVQVTLVDPEGNEWPVTYRCVPQRYSYEFRAGWRQFVGHWRVSTGDTVVLQRRGARRDRIRIHVHKPTKERTRGKGTGGGPQEDAADRSRPADVARPPFPCRSPGAAAAAGGRSSYRGGRRCPPWRLCPRPPRPAALLLLRCRPPVLHPLVYRPLLRPPCIKSRSDGLLPTLPITLLSS